MTDTPGQQRCTLCDCERIPLDREKTRFGACTNIQCEDPTLDYRNEQSTLPELLEKACAHVGAQPEPDSCKKCGETLPHLYPENCTDYRDWAVTWAQDFHETYERLANRFGYETRKESAKPWAEVPEVNQRLMAAVCHEVLNRFIAWRACSFPAPSPECQFCRWPMSPEGNGVFTCNNGQCKAPEYTAPLASPAVPEPVKLCGNPDCWCRTYSTPTITVSHGADPMAGGAIWVKNHNVKFSNEASPAVVTRVCQYGYQWCDGTNRHICEWCIKDLQAKVSGLEAQLQQAQAVIKKYEYVVRGS